MQVQKYFFATFVISSVTSLAFHFLYPRYEYILIGFCQVIKSDYNL